MLGAFLVSCYYLGRSSARNRISFEPSREVVGFVVATVHYLDNRHAIF